MPLVDLAVPVDAEVDHVRGAPDGTVTLVECGDYECPHCGAAAPVVLELLQRFDGKLRFVWRHLPLPDVHPNAALSAEAAEAAGAQGDFWGMHDRLLEDRDALQLRTWSAAHTNSPWMRRPSSATCGRGVSASGWPMTWRVPRRRAWRERRRSSSTTCSTAAPTTSSRSSPPSGPPCE